MGFTSDFSEESLLARVEDVVGLCDRRNTPCFLGFLDLHEQAIVRRYMKEIPAEQWTLYGGYEEAERCLLAVWPFYLTRDEVEFPFSAVAFRYRAIKEITHRDVLGTLLSAGIRRDTIGDILCGEGISVVFLRREVTPFVCEQIQKIGGEGVTVFPDYAEELPLSRTYEERWETIASPRLDTVVKALLHCSREAAAQRILVGEVSVNHIPMESTSAQITAPCTVSIRGAGRFLVDQIGPETKKGRLNLFARKCL